MPRLTMDVDEPEYQEILRRREMYRRYGVDYKDMMWAEDTLDRLEKKLPYGDYTDRDRADLLKIKDIHARVLGKALAVSGFSALQDGHISTHYIWHTQGDDKVRGSHAVNNGKIFAWSNAPSTGHPGEDFNCRCWAEPLIEKLEEKKSQIVAYAATDATPAWMREEFVAHYLAGQGETVTLSGIGHLQNVINYARSYIQPNGGAIFDRVENQIFAKARANGRGSFTYPFENSYDFTSVAWEIGGGTLRGSARVHVIEKDRFMVISADVDYIFHDRFTDPLDRYNTIPGDLDIIGKPYDINGYWKTRIEAILKKDSKESRFPGEGF